LALDFTGNKEFATSIGHALWQLWQILEAGKRFQSRAMTILFLLRFRMDLAGISLFSQLDVAAKKRR